MKKHFAIDETHTLLSVTVEAPCGFFQTDVESIVHLNDDVKNMFQTLQIVHAQVQYTCTRLHFSLRIVPHNEPLLQHRLPSGAGKTR